MADDFSASPGVAKFPVKILLGTTRLFAGIIESEYERGSWSCDLIMTTRSSLAEEDQRPPFQSVYATCQKLAMAPAAAVGEASQNIEWICRMLTIRYTVEERHYVSKLRFGGRIRSAQANIDIPGKIEAEAECWQTVLWRFRSDASRWDTNSRSRGACRVLTVHNADHHDITVKRGKQLCGRAEVLNTDIQGTRRLVTSETG